MSSDVPLVVPEVNATDLKTHRGIIANPNCCAAILVVPLWPIHRKVRIRRVVVSTYQSVSGAGAQAMAELEEQARAIVEGRTPQAKVFPHPIANNLFSHNSAIESNGYNGEENKIVDETRKILHAPDLRVIPTCVRVPVPRAHSESVLLDLEESLSADEARALLAQAPGIRVVDDAPSGRFPMPMDASGELDVLVGRVRNAPGDNKSLAMFICGDQLLKGAAWNAVQIAEELIR
jgi:aspartate-semialdehyde dehydrogenase